MNVSVKGGFVSGDYDQIKEVQRLVFVSEAVARFTDSTHKYMKAPDIAIHARKLLSDLESIEAGNWR